MVGLYSDINEWFFLGKNIKLGFPVVNPESGKQHLEYLKVKVSHLANKFEDNSNLIGKIIDEPDYNSNYNLGDLVSFTKTEITEMCSEGSC